MFKSNNNLAVQLQFTNGKPVTAVEGDPTADFLDRACRRMHVKSPVVGDPWDSDEDCVVKVRGNKGMFLPMPNGLTLSVQFGSMNYCAWDRSVLAEDHTDMLHVNPMWFPEWRSKDAEIAVIYEDNRLPLRRYDTVRGRVSANEVITLMRRLWALHVPTERHATWDVQAIAMDLWGV